MPKRNTDFPVSRAIIHQMHLKAVIRDIRLTPRLRLFAEVLSLFLDINDKDMREDFWKLINHFYIKSTNGPTLKDYDDEPLQKQDMDPKGEMARLWASINQSNLEESIKDANS
jgi:hypothetical protein